MSFPNINTQLLNNHQVLLYFLYFNLDTTAKTSNKIYNRSLKIILNAAYFSNNLIHKYLKIDSLVAKARNNATKMFDKGESHPNPKIGMQQITVSVKVDEL